MWWIVTIQKVLIAQLSVLETMTPEDFVQFRNVLNPASGFKVVPVSDVPWQEQQARFDSLVESRRLQTVTYVTQAAFDTEAGTGVQRRLSQEKPQQLLICISVMALA
jgi:hypothetical protein